MSMIHFHRSTAASPEQFIAGLTRLRTGPLGAVSQ
jgi:hypothetical protein